VKTNDRKQKVKKKRFPPESLILLFILLEASRKLKPQAADYAPWSQRSGSSAVA
jgi:hypothetical protein